MTTTRPALRWIVLAACILLLMALTQAAKQVFLAAIDSGWETMRGDIDSASVRAVTARLNEATVDFTNGIARLADDPATPAMLRGIDADTRQRTFRALRATADACGCSIELYDAKGALVAYAGRPVPKPPRTTAGGTSALLDDGPFTILAIDRPVASADGSGGHVYASMPLSAGIALNNRFFKESGVLDRIQKDLGIEIALDRDSIVSKRADDRFIAVPLVVDGRRLGSLAIARTLQAVHRLKIATAFDDVTFVLLLVLCIIGSVPFVRMNASREGHLRFIVAATLHIWIVRIVLYISGAESALLGDDLLNPASYASPFAYGLASSPGSLFLTVTALFLNVCAIYRHTQRPDFILRMRKRHAALLAVVICILVPLLVRTIVAALRSFVFDSSINYDDVASLFDQPMQLLMYVNTALLAGSLLLFLFLLAVYARNIARTISARRFLIISLLALIPAYTLFFILTDEFLIPVWIYLVVAFFAFLFLLMKGQRIEMRLAPANGFVLLWAITSVCCSILFSSFMDDRRRSEIEARADELARPVDGWSRVLVDQAIAGVQAQAADIDMPADSGGLDFKSAFALWSATTLSAQPNNSAVLITDTTGRLISKFFVGIDPGLATPASLFDAAHADTVEGGASHHPLAAGSAKLYVGKTRVATASGPPVDVTVALESIDPVQLGRSRVDPLRNTLSGTSQAPEDNFDITTFELHTADSTIRTGPGGLVIARGPAVAALAAPGQKRWMRFPGQPERPEYFVVPVGGGGIVTLIGVAPGGSDWLITLYRMFRLALIFLVVGLVLRILARGRRRSIRSLFPLRFGTRLQLAFLAVSGIPILVLWFTAQSFIQSNADADLSAQLKDRVATLRESVRRALSRPLTAPALQRRLSDADCYAISAAAGIPLNVYIGSSLSATSNPELYHTGLLNSNLKPSVFLRLHLLGSEFIFAHERIGSFTYAVGYGALRNDAGEVVAVISAPTLFEQSRIEASSTRAFAAIFLFMAVVLAAVIAIGRILARQISQPLTDLLDGTRAVAAGDFSGGITPAGAPETREVMDGFNRMTEQLRKQRMALAAYERELAWRDMAKQVAHEIRNPLTPLRLAVQHLRRAWSDRRDDFDTLLPTMTDMMIERIDALASISDEFARFARMPERAVTRVDVVELLHECVTLFSRQDQVAIALEVEGSLPAIEADRDELSRVFINLMRNAVQAVGDAGRIDITASATADTLTIAFTDSGSGIEPEVLPKIFEPNFSTKTGGMGLGLAIARRVVNDLNGSITAESMPGEGAVFTIRLPRGIEN